MLLAEVVDASARVAATRSRTVKVAALADVLGRAGPEEVALAASYLAGQLRQGRVGVGWGVLGTIEPPPAAAPTITLLDVDRAVDRLSALVGAGAGSSASRAAELTDLLGRATAGEADFLRRLLLGDLRQGALAALVVEGVAAASTTPAELVRRAVMLDGDLGRVATVAMAEGVPGLRATRLRLLRPVQPMLAATAPDVGAALCGQPCSVEWKLDGARIQAHREGDDVRLFTRNANDVTARLPGVAASIRSLPAGRVVLDGEVLGVDDEDRPDFFQDTMSRFGRRTGGGADLGVWFFDILHLEGRDLLDEPLSVRRGLLAEVVGDLRIPSVVTDDPEVAAAFFDRAMAAGHEGVVVKEASSPYEAGRRGSAWRKVKPVRTLDLVVLGAEWGHGRRRGWLSNLHLGARGPDGGFLMVGKTFKGLTDAMLTWQTERLLELEVARSGITVEVRPQLVVEIALDGVMASERYPGGVSLRFARVRRYRADKAAAEADTIEEVRAVRPGSA